MTHVSVTYRDGKAELVVDGHDITRHVLAEGFRIELSDVPMGPARVHMILAATEFDVDLPDAVLDVAREGVTA